MRKWPLPFVLAVGVAPPAGGVIAPVRAHDIGKDRAYAGHRDRPHRRHRPRVAYWAESPGAAPDRTAPALTEVELPRARHTPPPHETVEYLERQVIAIEREAGHREDIPLPFGRAAASDQLNRSPWPGPRR